jgi:outer membrane lipoprotein-sorting protein
MGVMSTTRRRLLASAAALAAAAALPGPAEAQSRGADTARPFEPSRQDLADIARMERYLNGIRTMRAGFRQVAEDGGEAEGTLEIWRPGLMRIDYARPAGDFIVSDGSFIFHWDDRMKTQSQVPVGQTLAYFILQRDIAFSGDVRVVGLDRRSGLLQATLVQSSDPGQGSLTLVFQDSGGDGPLQLRQWRVVDAQGLLTSVTLFGVETGLSFDRNRFYFRRPDGQLGPGRSD